MLKKLFIGLIIITLIIYIGLIILLGSVPPISRDALTHHLAIPKLYIQYGGIYEIPWLDFSYFPMNLDLLYTIPLIFGNDILPKYIHFGFGLGTCYLIYWYLKERLNSIWGLFGSLFFISIPIITKLSITIYVDLGLVFFTTASLLLLFEWVSNNYCFKYILLAAICCGLALGTKANGLLSLLLLSCLVPYLYLNSNLVNKNHSLKPSLLAIQYGVLFIAISLIIFSPWAIRNWIWVDNPFYPLFQSIFSAENGSPDEEIGFTTLTVRKLVYGESPLQILLLPIRLFFEGKDNVPQFFDGKLNCTLLLLPFLAFFQKVTENKNENIEKIAMLLFSILFLFWGLLLTGARIRYIVPIVPFLIILSCYGFYNLLIIIHQHTMLPPYVKRTITIVIVLFILAPNILYLKDQFAYIKPLNYISGNISKEEYITRYRPEYSVIQFINNSLPSKSRVLCFFMGNRGYYMNFDHRFLDPTIGHIPPFFKRNLGGLVTDTWQPSYLLVRNDLFVRWLQSLSKQKRRIFLEISQQKPIFSSGGYSIYQLIIPQKQIGLN